MVIWTVRCRRVLVNEILKTPLLNTSSTRQPVDSLLTLPWACQFDFLDSGKTRKSKEELFVGWEGLVRERKPLDVTWREHRRLNRQRKKTFQKLISVPHQKSLGKVFFVAQSSIGAKSFYSSISSYSNRLWWLINISINLSFILLISTCHQFTLALSPPVGIIRVQLNMFFVSNLINDDRIRLSFPFLAFETLSIRLFKFSFHQQSTWVMTQLRCPSSIQKSHHLRSIAISRN